MFYAIAFRIKFSRIKVHVKSTFYIACHTTLKAVTPIVEAICVRLKLQYHYNYKQMLACSHLKLLRGLLMNLNDVNAHVFSFGNTA